MLAETPENRAAWNEVRGALAEIRRRSEKAGADLIVVIFPHNLQVSASHLPFYEGLGFRLDPRLLTSQKPQRLMKRFCGRKRIACFDALPEARALPSDLYEKNDDHLSAEGAAAMEKIIFPFIRARLRAR